MHHTIGIRHAGVTQVTGALARAHSEIRAQLDVLERTAAHLRGAWSGEAVVAYESARRAWHAAMAELTAVLADATRLADSAAAAHRETEERVAGLW
jgi:WXG100 family type VII secretion target